MSKLKKIKYIGSEPSQTLESEKINEMIHCLSLSSPVSSISRYYYQIPVNS
jgi:hypothetical protein